MEKLTVLAEKVMKTSRGQAIVAVLAIVAPIVFIRTMYGGWFGPTEIFIGLQAQWPVWLIGVIANFATFFSVLPMREKGRLVQFVTAVWTIEMLLMLVASAVRTW